MKTTIKSLYIVALSAFIMVSCSEGNNGPEPSEACVGSYCVNGQTLAVCDTSYGIIIERHKCEMGCNLVENKCNMNMTSCTDNKCLDSNTLGVCNPQSKVMAAQVCLYGCDFGTGSCKSASAPESGCTTNSCKDADTLLVCDSSTGQISEQNCPYGCDYTTYTCKGAPSQPTGCTSNSCKDTNTLLVCDPSTGQTSEQNCPYGCDYTTTSCKPQPAGCTSDSCKNANILLVCNKSTGQTSEQTCPYGCDASLNQCKSNPNACTGNVCKDSKILLVCDTRTGETTEDTCEISCRDGACSEVTWCENNDDCHDASKPYCNTKTHACSADAACENAHCLSSEICSHGICIPQSDYNAMSRDACNPSLFVEHCRTNPDGRDLLYTCVKKNDSGDYMVQVQYCSSKRCAVYKDEDYDNHAVCVESASTGTCSSGKNTFNLCEEYNSGEFDVHAWINTYTCAKSINNEDIVYLSGMTDCGEGYSCYGNFCY